MKRRLTLILGVIVLSTVPAFAQPRGRKAQPSKQMTFTADRECDGGACHFEVITFKYGRNFSIAVGSGADHLTYYFSVEVVKGNVVKDYIYSRGTEEFFTEKESGRRVDSKLNALLLDVYKLGRYLIDNDVPVRGKRFSESGRFAVLANLRAYF